EVHRDVFAQLAGVNVDLDDFGVRGELGRVERHAVGKAGADGDDEVGLVDGLVGGVAAVHAQQAQAVRCAVAQHAGGHQRVGGGHAGFFQQVAQRLAAGRAAHAAAKDDDGAFGRVDHGGGRLDVVKVVPRDGAD